MKKKKGEERKITDIRIRIKIGKREERKEVRKLKRKDKKIIL